MPRRSGSRTSSGPSRPESKAIIVTLDRLRVATTEQLRRVVFHDLAPGSAARTAPAALASLAARQVVTKLERQVGGVRAGSRAAVWSLDARRTAACLGLRSRRRPDRRKPWTPSLAFLAHRLAVSECFVCLTEADRAGTADLLDFDAEPLCWRRFASSFGGTAR